MSSNISPRTATIVIGSGPGGYVAAIRLAQLGKDVALIEKDTIGGVCVNVGCIPSKALIMAGKLVRKARTASKMGIDADVRVDIQRLQEWKQSVVDKLASGVLQLCKLNKVRVIKGEARFLSSNSVTVTEVTNLTATVEFEQAIIATGSIQTEPPGVRIDGRRVISSTQALALKDVPRRMLILGGGAVGLEIGMAYSNLFGTRLVIVELMDRLLSGVDPEMVAIVARSLQRIGAIVHLKSGVKKVEAFHDHVTVVVDTPSGEETHDVDYLLVATGRRPNSSNLGLESLGIELDSRGFVVVDKRQRTNVSNVYAIGDVAGGPLLAHKASREGIVAAEAIAGLDTTFANVAIPSTIFTDPEIATVGMTPMELAGKSNVIVGKFPFHANGKALALAEHEGFVKIIADKESNRILSVGIVGSDSADLISEATVAIELGASLDDLASTIHPHPTLPEAIMEAAENALGKAIHIQNKFKVP